MDPNKLRTSHTQSSLSPGFSSCNSSPGRWPTAGAATVKSRVLGQSEAVPPGFHSAASPQQSFSTPSFSSSLQHVRTPRPNRSDPRNFEEYHEHLPPYTGGLSNESGLERLVSISHTCTPFTLVSNQLPEPSPPHHSQHLVKPIAIPATSAKFGSPFLRAYPPWLAGYYRIDRPAFLGFLDDLNRCAVARPPVKDSRTGRRTSSPTCPWPPKPTNADCRRRHQCGGRGGDVFAISKGRTEACVRAANRDVFAPRGLKVEIAKLDALAKIAGMPILDPVTGKVNKKAAILAPLDHIQESQPLSVEQRRLDAFQTWIAPLDLTPLPDVKKSNNVLGKSYGMQQLVRARGGRKRRKR